MQRVALLVEHGFSSCSFDVISAFETANALAGEKVYGVSIISEGGGEVPTSSGVGIETERLAHGDYDTLLVAAGYSEGRASRGVKEFVAYQVGAARRVGSICLGAFTLASCGALDGRRATTHWKKAQDLRRLYPRVEVEDERVYVKDRNVWSSGALNTGVDMALGMIERDYGDRRAEQVALARGVDRRHPGESQRSVVLELDPKSDRVKAALSFARQHIDETLQTAKLAGVAGISVRQFMRLFFDETGQTPAKAVELLRIEAAKFMLEQSRVQVTTVAERTGFGDRERMRRAFLRATGKSPQQVRLRAGVLAAF